MSTADCVMTQAVVKEETPNAPGAQKVLADEVAAPFRKEIREAVTQLGPGNGPKLVGFLANGDPAAKQYANWTKRAFAPDGLNFELREVEETKLEDELNIANCDPEVHGIMIYYPCFGQRPSFHGGSHDDYLRDSVSAFKDVEGLGHFYRRALYRNQRYVDSGRSLRPVASAATGGRSRSPRRQEEMDMMRQDQKRKCVLPCTPLAVIKCLEHLNVYDSALPIGDRMRGKTAVVINRSEVVGRPLAAMMANDGAIVYSVDVDSVYVFQRGRLEMPPEGMKNAEDAVRIADIVILGVPSEKYKLDASLIKENAVVINVATFKNIDEKQLLTTRPGVKYIGQVGKVTVAMLERNLMRLHQNFRGEVNEGRDGQPHIV